MFRKLILILVSITFVLGAVSTGFAETGNKRKGKYLYRKVYKACKERGEVDTAKPIVNPDSKTMAQWEKVFEKKDFSEFKCQKEWQALSEADLNHIKAYLVSGAADSPTPAKCK